METYEASAQQKAANITYRILQGYTPTTAEVAELYGVTWQGAYLMMNRISSAVPLTYDGQRWRLFEGRRSSF